MKVSRFQLSCYSSIKGSSQIESAGILGYLLNVGLLGLKQSLCTQIIGFFILVIRNER